MRTLSLHGNSLALLAVGSTFSTAAFLPGILSDQNYTITTNSTLPVASATEQTLPYIPSSILQNITTTVVSVGELSAVCFKDDKDLPVPLPRAKYKDCKAAKDQILPAQASLPMDWGTPGPKFIGFEIPYIWPKVGTCHVQIGPEYGLDQVKDTFPPNDVRNMALFIAQQCIKNQGMRKDQLGGTGLVGPKQIIRVSVLGDPPAEHLGTYLNVEKGR